MTPEMMQAALRDALAEARHDGGEALRKTLKMLTMTKPWEEAWRVGERGKPEVYAGSNAAGELWFPLFDVHPGDQPVPLARARLAAAAPDMARALAKLLQGVAETWGDNVDGWDEAVGALTKAGAPLPPCARVAGED